MEYIEKIKKMLCKELEEIAESGKLKSPADVSMIKDLTGAVKNIGVIEMQEEEDGYSERSNWMGDGRFYGQSYDDDSRMGGSSYARGRGRNAKRDSMGRYSRDDGMNYGMNYSRDDGKMKMIENLEDLAETADTKSREAIHRAIKQIENA